MAGAADCEAAVLALVVFLVTLALGKRLPARWRFGLWLVVFVRLALPMTPVAPWSVFRMPASPSPSIPVQRPQVAVSEPNAPPVDWVRAAFCRDGQSCPSGQHRLRKLPPRPFRRRGFHRGPWGLARSGAPALCC